MNGTLPMAVDARNLTYRYGSFTAVDDVTLQVRPGETMGLLGPNGAGKTTVVRMLTTLTPVQHGELLDVVMLVVAAIVGITTASTLLRRLVR